MTGPEHDPELEAFLKRRSPIHRRLADFDHAEPSIELDRLVLGRAREAIETPSQPAMFRATRWAMPVGLAATILIAFTVVLNIDRHALRVEKSVATAKAEPTAAPAVQLTANRAERGAGTVAADVDQAASGSERRAMRAERKAAAPITAATAANAAATAAESDSAASDVEKRRDHSLSDQPLLASSAAIRGTTDLTATSPAPAAPSPAASASASAPSSASASTPAAAPPPAYQASAESWLREINRLRASGKTTEAERELTAFRQAYPSHPGYSLARPPTR